jgi:hypothetical protein
MSEYAAERAGVLTETLEPLRESRHRGLDRGLRLLRRQAKLRRDIIDPLAALRRLHNVVEIHLDVPLIIFETAIDFKLKPF